MPEWLIDIYKAIGFALLLTLACGLLGYFWWWVSSGAWWGLVCLIGSFVVLLAGIPTALWLLGAVK